MVIYGYMYIYIYGKYGYLVGGLNPSEITSSSVGMMIFPSEWKNVSKPPTSVVNIWILIWLYLHYNMVIWAGDPLDLWL